MNFDLLNLSYNLRCIATLFLSWKLYVEPDHVSFNIKETIKYHVAVVTFKNNCVRVRVCVCVCVCVSVCVCE